MSTQDQQPTARIYRFPDRARDGRDEARRDGPASVTSLASVRQPAPPRPIMIGAWYHDDAIKEAPRAG